MKVKQQWLNIILIKTEFTQSILVGSLMFWLIRETCQSYRFSGLCSSPYPRLSFVDALAFHMSTLESDKLVILIVSSWRILEACMPSFQWVWFQAEQCTFLRPCILFISTQYFTIQPHLIKFIWNGIAQPTLYLIANQRELFETFLAMSPISWIDLSSFFITEKCTFLCTGGTFFVPLCSLLNLHPPHLIHTIHLV